LGAGEGAEGGADGDLPARLAEAWARLPVDLRDALGAMIVQAMEMERDGE
jgi:hypothetical protein